MIADQLRTKPDALHVFDSAAVEAGVDENGQIDTAMETLTPNIVLL